MVRFRKKVLMGSFLEFYLKMPKWKKIGGPEPPFSFLLEESKQGT
jgi:hypothetical protein